MTRLGANFFWAFGIASLLSIGLAKVIALYFPLLVSITSPVTIESPELVAQGRIYFFQGCAHCHGDDARGDEGPDLHYLMISDRHIAKLILGGIKGEMPSFRKKYQEPQVRAIIAYLRTLR